MYSHSFSEEWLVTTSYRHLKTLKLIADGNSKANRFSKNSDPKDRSLLEGRASGYFPSKTIYAIYLDVNPVTKEVRSCDHLVLGAHQPMYRNRSAALSQMLMPKIARSFMGRTKQAY